MQSLSPNLPPDDAARDAAPHADDPPFRGARLGRLSGRQDLWRRALLHRRGGGRGRRLFGARPRRPDHLDASRPWPLHRQGCRPQPHDGRALRAADRLLQGQGRLDAHRRFRHRHARRQRHRRGRNRDRHRRRPRGTDGRQGRGRGLVFRRRRIECRAVPRVPQYRGDLEVADALCVRKQHVRGEHRGRRDPRVERRGGARGRLRHSGCRRRRQRHLRGLSGGKPRRRAGALGRRPELDRVQDLPLARPHRAPGHGRCPRPGGDRSVEGEGPDRPARTPAQGAGLPRRRRSCKPWSATSWPRWRPPSPSPKPARSRCPSRRPTTCLRPEARRRRCES